MIFEFEQIDNYHSRAKVPGGWLVKAFENVAQADRGMESGWDWRVAMAFVPDPQYSWVITPKEEKKDAKEA